jgi:hypothetical protein
MQIRILLLRLRKWADQHNLHKVASPRCVMGCQQALLSFLLISFGIINTKQCTPRLDPRSRSNRKLQQYEYSLNEVNEKI